jgi:hypothetical protein
MLLIYIVNQFFKFIFQTQQLLKKTTAGSSWLINVSTQGHQTCLAIPHPGQHRMEHSSLTGHLGL